MGEGVREKGRERRALLLLSGGPERRLRKHGKDWHAFSGLCATHMSVGSCGAEHSWCVIRARPHRCRFHGQGVQTLNPSGRPKVTLTVHPDTAFTGAHVDFMKLLKLDNAGGSVVAGTESVKPGRSVAGDGDNDDAQSYAAARRVAGGGKSRRVLAASRSARASSPTGQQEEPARNEEAGGGEKAREPDAAGGDTGEDVDDDGHESGSAKSSSATDEDEDEAEEPKADGTDAAILHRQVGLPCCGGVSRAFFTSLLGHFVTGHKPQMRVAPVMLPVIHVAPDDACNHNRSYVRQATNKSDFVAQWVRTLSKQVSGKSLLPDLAGSNPKRLTSPRATSTLLAAIPEAAEAGEDAAAASAKFAARSGSATRHGDLPALMGDAAGAAATGGRELAASSSPPGGKGKGKGKGKKGPAEDDESSSGGDDDGEGKGKGKDDRSENGSEAESSASGSQAASAISGD